MKAWRSMQKIWRDGCKLQVAGCRLQVITCHLPLATCHKKIAILLLLLMLILSVPSPTQAQEVVANEPTLSPMWKPLVQQWSSYIYTMADSSGLDPDFIAAVVNEESNGDPSVVSHAGAVGLMGVMPTGPGLEWRPSPEELQNPMVNLRWGVAILAEVVKQSGGDLYAALAAYSGGWDQVNSRVPRAYAANVLDNYGRAVLIRHGLSPDIAAQWTIAIELTKGNVPQSSLLVLGDQPLSGLHTYAEHLIFNYVDEAGNALYIRGYVVPVALVVPLDPHTGDPAIHELSAAESPLNNTDGSQTSLNPRVLLACLPSLGRLRGHVSTRWFAPTDCPDWHR